MDFVVCANCNKTMPKQETGFEPLDNMTPALVWCCQICKDEWDEKQDKNAKYICYACSGRFDKPQPVSSCFSGFGKCPFCGSIDYKPVVSTIPTLITCVYTKDCCGCLSVIYSSERQQIEVQCNECGKISVIMNSKGKLIC